MIIYIVYLLIKWMYFPIMDDVAKGLFCMFSTIELGVELFGLCYFIWQYITTKKGD